MSGFGSNGLDTILKSRGIRNIALGGFSTEGCVFATLLSAYDLGYHVYAVKDAMASDQGQYADLTLRINYPRYSPFSTTTNFCKWSNDIRQGKTSPFLSVLSPGG